MTTTGPSRSAMLVAACRALADEQPPSERLISDPIARSFIDDEALRAARNDPALQRVIRLRTRAIDDWLLAFCAAHPESDVVLLGAGIDARSFRLSVDARYFEIDMPTSVDGKQQIIDRLAIAARDRRTLGVDLTTARLPPALASLGLRNEQPSFAVWEGVVFYLDEASASQVLVDLGATLAPGSELAFDYVELPTLSDTDRANTTQIGRGLRDGGETLRNGLRDVHEHLDRAGFDVIDDEVVELLAPRYGLAVGTRTYPSRIVLARRR